MTPPGPAPSDVAEAPLPDPRFTEWAARLRAAIGEERNRRSTHERITRVIARDPIRAVIAELEEAAGA